MEAHRRSPQTRPVPALPTQCDLAGATEAPPLSARSSHSYAIPG